MLQRLQLVRPCSLCTSRSAAGDARRKCVIKCEQQECSFSYAGVQQQCSTSNRGCCCTPDLFVTALPTCQKRMLASGKYVLSAQPLAEHSLLSQQIHLSSFRQGCWQALGSCAHIRKFQKQLLLAAPKPAPDLTCWQRPCAGDQRSPYYTTWEHCSNLFFMS